MSRIVSVTVKEITADKEVIEEALSLLERYNVVRKASQYDVGGVQLLTENGKVVLRYYGDSQKSTEMAAKVRDALIAASVARSLRLLGVNVRVMETPNGFTIEGWT